MYTCEEAINDFLLSRDVAPATLRTYKEHLIMVFKNQMEKDVDEIEIHLEDSKPSSRESYLRSVRAFYNYIGKEPPKVKHIDTRKDIYTDDEIKILLKRPKGASFTEYRNWCIVMLVCDTGMRAGSLREIKKTDIQGNKVVLRHTKNGKINVVPFSDTTRLALKRLMNNNSEYVFTDCYGGQMSENCLKEAIRKYNLSRGVQKTSLHLMRHWFATKWVENGGNVFTLKEVLGHETLAMSMHYTQVNLEKVYKSPVEGLQRQKIRL